MDPREPTQEEMESIIRALNMVAKTKTQLRIAVAHLDGVMNDVRESCNAPIGHVYDTTDKQWVRTRTQQQTAQQAREPTAGRVVLPRGAE